MLCYIIERHPRATDAGNKLPGGHFPHPLIYSFNLESQLIKNKFLFTMMVYTGQTLGQLCTALWVSQSRAVVRQSGFEPGCL